ncbi:MAG: beta-ketoacyl-ACP synthase II [Candidatus Delongbacteria bacterium]|nr:beta-ketoacyl-ACP synthase II [Candidatus Delongbacteria bacterium]
MERKRVVITGLGTVNPLANNVRLTWDKALSGQSGIDYITHFDVSDYKTKIAGEVRNLDYSQILDPKEAKRMDNFCIYGMCAGDEAIRDSGLNLDQEDPTRIGIIIGTGMGGIATFEEQLKTLFQKGPSRVSPFFIPMLIPDILPGQLAIRYGLKGDNYTITSACASSAHALSEAYWTIATGRQTIIISGGAEATISPTALAGFNSMRAISVQNDNPATASKPFDLNRDGFVMSEGSAILVLEELEHARSRNAKIYAEFIGFGFSCDAYHITAPDMAGAVIVMKKALDMAGIQPEQIGHINAHGTSTPPNDKSESQAIKQVFGEHAYRIKVCSTKSMTGHMLGAAGAVEAILTSLSLQHQIILPTINYQTPDPDCDLDYNPHHTSPLQFDYALSNSFGFGGHNCSIILKRYHAE